MQPTQPAPTPAAVAGATGDIGGTGDTSEVTDAARAHETLHALRGLVGTTTQALNSPLEDISGALKALRAAAQTWDAGAMQQAMLRIAQDTDQTRAALTTLDALLDAYIEPPRVAPVELADLLMTILPRWKTLAPHHSFELALPGHEPTILCDGSRLDRALTLLLEYVVALTPMGGDVRVSLRSHPLESGQGEEAQISVRCGAQVLSSEALAQVFEPFSLLTTSPDAPLCGGGLGLTLARALVATQGGRIWAEGTAGMAGLTLTLALPPEPAEYTELASAPAVAAAKPLTAAFATPSESSRPLALARAQRVALVVMCDARMARYLRANYEAQGYRVVAACELAEALRQVDLEEPDLILLDMSLCVGVAGDPLAPLRRLVEYAAAPVIALGCAGDTPGAAHVLDAGAADYLPLPFHMEELLARARAALRVRAATAPTHEPVFTSGDLSIDFAHRQVTVAGNSVALSKTEYKLLRVLAQHAGMALTHETLLERVWGKGYSSEVEFIWVYVRRLRRKIEPDPAHPRHILTVPGVGYRLARISS